MKPLRLPPAPARLGLADIAILCLLGGVIAMVVSFAREFEAPFSQAVRIDLRPAALPWYTLYSLSRGLMSLFPTRNVGLELAAILMIFTAQAWNLALSFYNSLKALPQPLRDACKVAGWPPGRTFRQLEVPAAAQGLVWNGMLSMAGGWFFLMVNEAFRLGDRDYRLPGIGSYMSVALDQGNAQAMALAIAAMVAMIVCVDQLLWRPLVVWVEKFRLDESSGGGPGPSSWVLDFLRRGRSSGRSAPSVPSSCAARGWPSGIGWRGRSAPGSRSRRSPPPPPWAPGACGCWSRSWVGRSGVGWSRPPCSRSHG